MANALSKIKEIVKSYKGIPDDDIVRDSMYAEISKVVKTNSICSLILNFEVKDYVFTGEVFFQNNLEKVSRLDLINV